MPDLPKYPGVYVTEVPSGVRTIEGVPTSVTAFLGRARRGPVDVPVDVVGIADFERLFGGMWVDRPLTYAVDDFFANGGTHAIVVRLFKQSAADQTGVAAVATGGLQLAAAAPGEWGNRIETKITRPEDETAAEACAKGLAERGIPVSADDLFDLTIVDNDADERELFRNLTVEKDGGPRRIDRVLAEESAIVRVVVDDNGDPVLPSARPPDDSTGRGTGGDDGAALDDAAIVGFEHEKTGLHALLKADIFNILCIPPDARGGDVGKGVWEAAAKFCHDRRAFLIIDPPALWDANPETAIDTVSSRQQSSPLISLTHAANAALYFPRLRKRDSLREGQLDAFVPSGAIAGIMARTDAKRGVWKAPAGKDATITGADALTVEMTEMENGILNPIGVNCLRSFPGIGLLVWGARTLRGADDLGDEFRYVPVRRVALFIEESILRGTRWVVFEPNAEPLWSQIRLNVNAFMIRLFRDGAFQGSTPDEAYFVRCGSETTTRDDIDRGIVNMLIGFAPLEPAEFVIIRIQQSLVAS